MPLPLLPLVLGLATVGGGVALARSRRGAAGATRLPRDAKDTPGTEVVEQLAHLAGGPVACQIVMAESGRELVIVPSVDPVASALLLCSSKLPAKAIIANVDSSQLEIYPLDPGQPRDTPTRGLLYALGELLPLHATMGATSPPAGS